MPSQRAEEVRGGLQAGGKLVGAELPLERSWELQGRDSRPWGNYWLEDKWPEGKWLQGSWLQGSWVQKDAWDGVLQHQQGFLARPVQPWLAMDLRPEGAAKCGEEPYIVNITLRYLRLSTYRPFVTAVLSLFQNRLYLMYV